MPSLRNFHKLLDPEIRAKNLRAMGFALRGRYWDLARSRAADPVFVVGCSRSGTTVTYETIAKGGIVRDEAKRGEAVQAVVAFAREGGFEVKGVIESPVRGAEGNVEYLMNATLS